MAGVLSEVRPGGPHEPTFAERYELVVTKTGEVLSKHVRLADAGRAWKASSSPNDVQVREVGFGRDVTDAAVVAQTRRPR